MNTTFSLSSFVQYFEKNEKLVLPPQQSLIVNEIDIVLKDPSVPHPNVKNCAIGILCRILSVIGKNVIIHNPPTAKFTAKVTPYLSLNSSEGMSIDTRKEQVICPILKVFFEIMLQCRIFNVQSSPDQKNIFPLDLEQKSIQSKKKMSEIVHGAAPAGYEVDFRYHDIYKYAPSGIDYLVGEGIKITLKPRPIRFSSVLEFCKELEERKGITLKPNQMLSIHVEDASQMKSLVKRLGEENASFKECLLYLEQLVLPTGKNLTFSENFSKYIYDFQDATFSISFANQTTLFLDDNNCSADLCWLGSQLARSGKSITMDLDQPLFIMDPSQKIIEIAKLGDVSMLLEFYNPIAFSLELTSVGSVSVGKTLRGISIIIIKPLSSTSLVLSMKEVSQEEFIKNTLRVMHPHVAEGVKQGEIKAVTSLLFFVMWYYLGSDFKDFYIDKLPLYFKGGAYEKMVSLREDEVFQGALNKVMNQDKFCGELFHLVQMDPNQFDAINPDQLEGPLGIIFRKLKEIIVCELKNIPFPGEGILESILLISDEQINPFIQENFDSSSKST